MNASLLNEYRQLHLTLSGELDGDATTALAPPNHRVDIMPALQVPVPPVIQMVQDGWGHDEVPLMMRDVMSSVHRVVKDVSHEEPVWKDAVRSFNEMIRITVETLRPCKGNGLSITNNVMLDTLRNI